MTELVLVVHISVFCHKSVEWRQIHDERNGIGMLSCSTLLVLTKYHCVVVGTLKMCGDLKLFLRTNKHGLGGLECFSVIKLLYFSLQNSRGGILLL